MNRNDLCWAKAHDWYDGYYTVDGTIHIQVMDGETPRLFSSFDELYVWAGY